MTLVTGGELLAYPKVSMMLAGFWNQPITNNAILQTAFNAYCFFTKGTYIFFWFMLVAEEVRITLGDYPLELVIGALSVVVNATKILVKLFVFLKNNLLEMFRDIAEQERMVWRSEEGIQKVYQSKIWLCKTYALLLSSLTYLTVGSLVISGGFATIQLKKHNEAHNDTLESHFMYMTYYPRDKLNHLYATFTMQIITSWVAANFNVITHLLFLILLIYSAAQLEMLQVRLRNYIEPDFDGHANPERMNQKIWMLKGFILEHKKIIEFVKTLNERTKNIVMMEFIMSSLDVASVSVTIVKMDSDKLLWMLPFLMLLSIQIFALGWSCNEIKVQSEAIGDAAFESRWYLLNKEGRQLTQGLISRAQKSLTITIGAFGPMTTNSVVLIMKTSYSYVSIMNE